VAAARARVDNARAQLAVVSAGSRGARDAAVAARAQVAAIESQVRGAEVSAEQAEKEKARIAALAAQRAVPGAQLETVGFAEQAAAERVDAAKASARAARLQSGAAHAAAQAEAARIDVARTAVAIAEAEAARAQLAVDECTIEAPGAGAVTARLFEPGAVIGPGTPIVTIVDVRTVTATFFLPNAELGRVSLGMPAALRVDAYPDRVFAGVVRRIAAQAEFTSRNVQTREDRDRLVYAVDVAVDNADGALRAGMPGQITIPGTER
jgi:HlyD family secretion protein